MNKKGAEIALNVVIIAVISLVVIVLVIAIFTGKLNLLSVKSGDCAVQGGKCAANCGSADDGTADYGTENPSITCPPKGDEAQRCCLKIKV